MKLPWGILAQAHVRGITDARPSVTDEIMTPSARHGALTSRISIETGVSAVEIAS